ncbi:MAG: oligopeptidase A [Gammaproteobacteria bacterium]
MKKKLDRLPQFSAIDIANLPTELQQLLDKNRDKIKQLVDENQSPTWDSLLQPLEDMDDEIHFLWSPLSHMNSVVNNDTIRKAYQACLPILTEYGSELGQNEKLYGAVQALAESDAFKKLTVAQKKIIENDLRDFRLSGVHLDEADKKRFKAIKKRLSELNNKFSENILDASDAWQKHITDKKLLAGVPERALTVMQQAAQAKDLEGYLLTLDFPCYHAIIAYADDAKLREELYTAFTTRASEQGPQAKQWDNSPIMDEMIALRHEFSQLLGYAHYTEYSLATKMVKDREQACEFLNDLVKRTKQQAEKEFQQLCQFSKDNYKLEKLNAWDVSYMSEKLRQQRYDIDEEQLRPYFPKDRVIQGMFEVVNKLYGIHLKKRAAVDTWHKDVEFFEIFDEDGSLRGALYMDLYARSKKRDGAWMDECIVRRRLSADELQLPVAYLTCNFAPASGDKPALLSHQEVITLFHEFGHCLHHLLTQVDYAGVSGINGVPWDAVELPSQFFEKWCWQPEAVDLISGHYQTKEVLPPDLFKKLDASKDFQAAMKLMRQLEFGLFDWRIHDEYDAKTGAQIQSTLDEVRTQVSVVPTPSYNRFQHSFSHIFAGGYAAGYYSYAWAEVLSSDAFSKFEETGIFNSQTGREFLHHILEQGGTQEPMALFTAFRGREPTLDAFLRQRGIV